MTTQINEVKPGGLVQIDPAAAKQLDTKLQAPTLAGAEAISVEAEGNKGVLMQRMIKAAELFANAEDSLSKGLGADLVLTIVPLIRLPEKIRPKYAEIDESLCTAMRRTTPSRQWVKNPDETFSERFGTKPAYKQGATRWVDMARWENGQYTKQEQKHQERVQGWKMEAVIYGTPYTSPVSALRAGIAYTTVHTHFRNILRPTFVDLSVLSDKVQEKLAADAVQADALKVPMRIEKDGQIVKTRTKVLGNAALTHGAVKALLGGMKGATTQRRYDELVACLLLVKPEPKPDTAK